MNREKIRRLSIAELSSLRLGRLLVGTSLLLSSLVLFEWETSLKTWASVAALALGLVCFYQATIAWIELKSRGQSAWDQDGGQKNVGTSE